MIGDLFDSPWKILIVAVVLIVLFGSKKLPDAARSLGKSMRILKREVQDLGHEGHDEHDEAQPPKAVTAPQPQHQQQIDELQQQIRDLQQQAPAGGTTAANGAPLSEAQRTQQPG